MKRIYPKWQERIILLLISCLCFIQTYASAKAGEAEVYEGSTVTIALASVYERTLRNSTGITYEWYSENNSYATVVSSTKFNATVRGIKATQSCKVYFKCSYYLDGFYRTMDFYYTITVKGKNVSVSRVELSQYNLTLKEGIKTLLTAWTYPSNATNPNVRWSSDAPSVAKVDGMGYVTGISAGTATIKCQAVDGGGAYATCLVTVVPRTTNVTDITLNHTSYSLNVGEGVSLSASVSPSNATDKSVEWLTSKASVASVSSTGYVTAKSEGTTIITCRANDGSGISATCLITVNAKEILPTGIKLDTEEAWWVADNADDLRNTDIQIEAEVSPADATNKTITWSSDNTEVATVSSSGMITPRNFGTANIMAKTVNNLVAICKVEIFKRKTYVTWKGKYKVSSSHVVNNPTRDYWDDFDMTIEEKFGESYITYMFGVDLAQFNDGGLKLKDNGDSTATIDLSEYNVLQYTDDNHPLYTMMIYDEEADDWTDNWTLIKNEDGTLSLGDFYVAAFKWSEAQQLWTDGVLEAGYFNMTARLTDDTSLPYVTVEKPNIHVEGNTVRLGSVVDVTVYQSNGKMVYSGKTDHVDNLASGLYIIRIGNNYKKIIIR